MNEHSFIFTLMRAKDEVKERSIRDKALQMIVKEGLTGFSMHKLATVVGVSPATIYIYFKSKDDLIKQLSAEAGDRMIDITFKNFDSSMSFRDGLRMQWINRIKYCMKFPDQMDFIEQLRHSAYSDHLAEIMGEKFKAEMGEFVHNAIASKELVTVPVEVYWSIAFAPLYNLVKFHMNGKGVAGKRFVLTEKIMLETLDLVLKALTPEFYIWLTNERVASNYFYRFKPIQMDILVFKTNIRLKKDHDRISKVLSGVENIVRWNVDKHDADKVLRVECDSIDPVSIINTIIKAGYHCEELPD